MSSRSEGRQAQEHQHWPRHRASPAPEACHAGKRLPGSGDAGFTLVELLVVMVILVLLASLVTPRILQYVGSSRTKAAQVQIESFATALELFKLDIDRYPTTGEGLSALVKPIAGATGWNGPYLKNGILPLDPWGGAYVYRSPGQRGQFEIWSYGADKQPGGTGEAQDVHSR